MTLRYLKLALVLGALFGLPLASYADTSEAVTNLTQTATLNHAGTLTIVETIDYDFGPTSPHDITFSIPLTYHDDQGRDFRMTFKQIDTARAAGLRTEVSTAAARVTLPAGTGADATRHYEFSYTLSPVVLHGLAADIFRLSVTGLSWSVPINQASLKLETPVAPADNLTCYSGAAGSTTGRCSVQQQGNVSTIISYAPLQPGEGLSVFANFPHNSVEQYLQTYEQHPSSPLRKIFEFIGIIIVLSLIVIGLATWLRRRYTKANEATKNQADRQ
jgi:hypothetical protein